MMLQLYLGALAFGGTLLLASLVLGAGQKDLDKDVDGGPDADATDAEAGAKGDLGGAFAWLPVTSLRFWTFFLAFGGGVGTALTYAGAAGPLVVAGAALATGYVAGVAIVTTLRSLTRHSVGSEVSIRELAGESADVLVTVARGEVGKIRVSAKGRVIDLIAETDDEYPLPAGTRAIILGEGAEGRVQVTKP